MSLLIRCMKMPSSCYDCPVEREGDVCGITKGGCTWDVKPPHCPLIEVQELQCPHWFSEGHFCNNIGMEI